ncbi:hypothetical protein LTR37_014092 [Vermiconidia calcicola]|uniref:Uncharacterized protein n=1 Tax=Vermiconidia calcicola TaxID=1690605 RepID=A0ACC3MUT9_9PEZI|nr:hypothetical protein LTR37_014092 [Vermiconidia calcicola]
MSTKQEETEKAIASLKKKGANISFWYLAVLAQIPGTIAAGAIYCLASQCLTIVPPFELLNSSRDYTQATLFVTLTIMLIIYLAVSWMQKVLFISWAFEPSKRFYEWIYTKKRAAQILGEAVKKGV